MAMTVRLSAEAEQKLDAIVRDCGLSKNAVLEQAILNWDAHSRHREIARTAADLVRSRDAELLELLSR